MTIVKAAIFLLAAASFGVASTKPFAAESEQAQFYNSPAAAAANLPFSQAVRVGRHLVSIRCNRRSSGENGTGSRRVGSGSQANNGKHWCYLAVEWLKFR